MEKTLFLAMSRIRNPSQFDHTSTTVRMNFVMFCLLALGCSSALNRKLCRGVCAAILVMEITLEKSDMCRRLTVAGMNESQMSLLPFGAAISCELTSFSLSTFVFSLGIRMYMRFGRCWSSKQWWNLMNEDGVVKPRTFEASSNGIQ
ncbi:hypothetical protein AC1031_016500 [Aphanomyces cochlioides]|nr:hypothetical protein AC1031_016500 [Aphanomyces cochlioides]